MRSLFKRPLKDEPVQTSSQPVNANSSGNHRTDVQPVRTGSQLGARDSPSWHTAEEHAEALLSWMQQPGGRVGEVPARELMQSHAEMCAELFWEQLPWIPVAKAFRRLIDDPRRHLASRNSRRIVVYYIPGPAIVARPARQDAR